MKIDPSLNISQNQKGSVLLLALALLVLMTLAGLSALNTTTTEIQVAGNDRCFKQNLYRAESAIVEAAQRLSNDTAPHTNLLPGSGSSLSWVHANTGTFIPLNDAWEYSGGSQNATRSSLFTDNESGYTVVYNGITAGSSLDISDASIMRLYDIFSRSERCGGNVEIIAGYRIRF